MWRGHREPKPEELLWIRRAYRLRLVIGCVFIVVGVVWLAIGIVHLAHRF